MSSIQATFSGKAAQKRQNILDFNEEWDDEVAMTSAGPYVNLHLDPRP